MLRRSRKVTRPCFPRLTEVIGAGVRRDRGLICLLLLVLVTHPWLTWFGTFGPPTPWEVGEFNQARVLVDRMVEAAHDRFGIGRHAVTEELPGTILDVM